MPQKVTIRYSGLIRNALGVQEEDVHVVDDMQVRDLVAQLWQRHGNAFAFSVLNRDGSLRRTSRILLDNRDIGEMEGLDTKLEGYTQALITVVVYPDEGG